MSESVSTAIEKARRVRLGGIALVMLAAVFWSLNGALIKKVNDGGRGPDGVTIAFYRSFVAGLFLLPLARGKWASLGGAPAHSRNNRKRPPSWVPKSDALWCMVFFTLMTVSFVVANTLTQAANVIILQYTSTFWVFGLSPAILQEKPRSSDLWMLALAFAGIVIIFAGESIAHWAWTLWTDRVPPDAAGTVAPSAVHFQGLCAALGSGLFYALLTLMIRRLRHADSAAVTVLNNLGSAILLLPVVLLVGNLAISTHYLLLLVFMGVAQFGLPYYLYTLGLARVPAYQAALITMLEPVLVPIWAYFAVGEIVPPWTMVGGGVILLALLLFVNAARRSLKGAPTEAIS